MKNKELSPKKEIIISKFNVIRYLEIYFVIIFKKIFIYLKQKNNFLLCKLGYPINNNPNSFEDLTPVIITDGDIYIDSLFWALRNKNVKNIALTGSYGSGKSSILKTFKEKHFEFEYLNISLATFDDLFEKDNKKNKSEGLSNSSVPNKSEPSKSEEVNKKIELSILQQMLYVEKSSTIPNSRFQRIKNLKSYSILIYSLFCLTTVLGYIFLFHNNLITKLNCIKYYFFESEYCDVNFKFFEILSILFLLFGAFYIIKGFVRTVGDFKFNKINLKGEVELNREVTDNSILNRNIDEIIYFFERTKYNVVIIEDLDRFKEPEIFTKLREINLLINLSKQVNRHIVFIYALKDEMFKNSDRTKFFDFILPIIPVINSSNSYDFLLDKFVNEVTEDEKIDSNFLYDISLYIDDMRLLKNIVNEYKIYYDKLTKKTTIKLLPNKLLSFIIYKNLFPKDFAKLHKNEGMVYQVFNIDLNDLKVKLIDNENLKIKENLNEVARIKKLTEDKTRIDNVKDLRKLYVFELFKLLPSETVSIVINEKPFFLNQINNLIEDDVFNEIRNVNEIKYATKLYDPYANSRMKNIINEIEFNFNAIENLVDINLSYDKRIELIFEKDNIEIEELKNENQIHRESIEEIKSSSLEELLSKHKCSDLLNPKIQKSDVLIYFISNGYIAEDYFDYISIFNEGDITLNDKNFILSIRNNKELPVDYKLNKSENILKHLKNDFHKNEILNINFIDYLLKNSSFDNYELFNQFCDKNERVKLFIELYFKTGSRIEEFTKLVCKYDLEFWYYIENSNLTINEKDLILKILLSNVRLLNINSQNQRNKLTNYISKKGDFLNLMNFESDIVKSNLLILKVKFQFPLDHDENKELFNFIYHNNLYELNPEMIRQIILVQTENNMVLVSDLDKCNYTTILESNCDELVKYIKDNIEEYLVNVFLNIETNKNESVKIIINLLNEKIDDDIKLSIISSQNFIIEQILDVKSDYLWIELVNQSKMKTSWENVINYCLNERLDEHIVKFLNIENNYLELSKIDINSTSIDDEDKDKFINNLITTNDLTEDAYLSLLNHIQNSIDNIKIEELNEHKIKILIEKGIISLNKKNLESLRQYSQNKQVLLIKQNFDEYIKQISEGIDFELSEKEYDLLLSSDLIHENKVILISEIEESYINEKSNLGNLIGNILNNEKPIAISYSYFINLLKSIKSSDTKVKLCNIYLNLYSKEVSKIEDVLIALNPPFTNIMSIGSKKPPIPNNKWNLRFIENLKTVKYIVSFSGKDEDKITKIRKSS